MKKSQQLSNFYRSFCFAEGSQHIASEYAILKLQKLIEVFKIKNVLEIGLGIGSISGILLLLNKNLKYSGTEANDFCLNALSKNLKENYSRLTVYSDLTDIPTNKEFDLIIIDGKDKNHQVIKELIAINGILAIEGDRIQQQDSLREFFPNHKYVHSISKEKNKDYSPFQKSHWQGGLKIIYINPTAFQKLSWMREKIYTKWKYWLLRSEGVKRV